MDVDTPIHSVEEHTRRDLFDPLTFDLPNAVRGLQATTLNDSYFLKVIDTRLLDTFVSAPTPSLHTSVLNTVSQCLLNPEWTRSVVASFRPIAIDLVARWLTPGFTSFLESVPPTNGAVYRLETVAKAFSLLLPTIPQVKSLAVSYFSHSPSLFDNIHQLTLKDGEFSEVECGYAILYFWY
jgi:midasin